MTVEGTDAVPPNPEVPQADGEAAGQRHAPPMMFTIRLDFNRSGDAERDEEEAGEGDDAEAESPPTKTWVIPQGQRTFVQLVRLRERELGWRCDDVRCQFAPHDGEDECESSTSSPSPSSDENRMDIDMPSMIHILAARPGAPGSEPVCAHEFHPSCLVSATRATGCGEPPEATPDDPRVTVRCPLCRAIGSVDRAVWEEGQRL